jgi:hypothetical protein
MKKDYGIYFWLHLFVIVFWYVMPFLFSWYWLMFGVVFSYGQGLIINGCVLTYAQFGKGSDETFFAYYLRKIGINLNKKTAKLIFFWIEPIAIFSVALIWQLILGFKPALL